jgi:hypothetical protein
MIAGKRGAWIVAKIGDVYTLMNQEKVGHIGISAVGARIWELIEAPRDVEVICAQLRKEYAIDSEACRQEVEAFLNDLAQQGVVAFETKTPEELPRCPPRNP